jgi:hypothetical protein
MCESPSSGCLRGCGAPQVAFRRARRDPLLPRPSSRSQHWFEKLRRSSRARSRIFSRSGSGRRIEAGVGIPPTEGTTAPPKNRPAAPSRAVPSAACEFKRAAFSACDGGGSEERARKQAADEEVRLAVRPVPRLPVRLGRFGCPEPRRPGRCGVGRERPVGDAQDEHHGHERRRYCERNERAGPCHARIETHEPPSGQTGGDRRQSGGGLDGAAVRTGLRTDLSAPSRI